MNEDLNRTFKGIQSDLDKFWSDVKKDFDNSNTDLTARIKALEAERDDLREKYNNAQSKITHIESQLESTVSKLEDFSKDQKKDIDALQLLDIYLVLMGEVFSAAAHVRILFILHGEKNKYTLDELAIASAYPKLQVRQTIFELRNSNIVEFNEDTNEVSLLQRFM